MAPLSYNISTDLKNYLNKIDKYRAELLLYPLNLQDETNLRYEVSKKRGENEVFDYIKENWYVTSNPITIDIIKKIYEIATGKSSGPRSGFTDYSEKNLNTFLEYFNKSNDHPVIQAGIMQAEIIKITPFINETGRVARLMSYLVLYRFGYDVRGVINFEDFYKSDPETYRKMVDYIKTKDNLSLWLEYFSYVIMVNLQKALQDIKKINNINAKSGSVLKLNSRQRKILIKLQEPDLKITNKDVQKKYKVSQITASRDLAKLHKLGLVFSHGKGRSVSYTKA